VSIQIVEIVNYLLVVENLIVGEENLTAEVLNLMSEEEILVAEIVLITSLVDWTN